jgi:hypothetical protein
VNAIDGCSVKLSEGGENPTHRAVALAGLPPPLAGVMEMIGWRKVHRRGLDADAEDVKLTASKADIADGGVLHKLIAGATV